MDKHLKSAQKLINFINTSPSPYHVVKECKNHLKNAGFKELVETQKWNVEPMGKYFITRNQSSILAFAVGGNVKIGNCGFTLLGAHTDSPGFRVKAISKREKEGYNQVGVECYGGGNWVSWFDRDLKVAGRALVKSQNKIISKLLHINKPLMRIPHCAIHLMPKINQEFSINKETELIPIIGLSNDESSERNDPNDVTLTSKHHKDLLDLVSAELNCSTNDLIDIDLYLADFQNPCIGGALNDLIFAPRIDNLLNTYCGMKALINSSTKEDLKNDSHFRVFLSFDNEEVGSESTCGASSSFAEHVLRRSVETFDDSNFFEKSICNSMVLSADMSHGVHPNYAEKHEDLMKPSLNGGVVIKTNTNQKYATNSLTSTIIEKLAQIAQVPIQHVMTRNDSPCGSTIGPLIAEKLGIPTVDVGSAQLSMHSCREMCGIMAPLQSELLFTAFYSHFSKLNAQIYV